MNHALIHAIATAIEKFSKDIPAPVQIARRPGSPLLAAHRSSQVLAYSLVMKDPTQLEKLKAKEDALAHYLMVMANFRTEVVFRQSWGALIAELSLPGSMFTELPLSVLQRRNGGAVALGRSVLGQQVDFALGAGRIAHALIAGTTEAGKSVTMQTIISQLATQNQLEHMRLLLIDGKRRAFLPYQRLPHLIHPVIHEANEAALALGWIKEEIGRRENMQPNDVKKLPRLVVAIDELAFIIGEAGGTDGPAADALRTITSKGRELGIHVIAATQHPTQDNLGGNMARANFSTRLVLKVVDSPASTLAGGQAGLNAHKLNARGDCIFIHNGHPVRIQVARAPDTIFDSLPAADHIDQLPLREVRLGAGTPPEVSIRPQPDPLTATQIAWALANKAPGITKTADALSIGAAKAKRLKEHTEEIINALGALGYGISELPEGPEP